MKAILNIHNISKHYDGIIAVDSVTFSVLPGTITGIFGDNGAGKTTLFNLISGFEKADKGRLLFNGKDITHKSVINRVKLGMGRLFQTARVFNDVTVLDNLLAAGNNHEARRLYNYIIKYRAIKLNNIKNQKKAYDILNNFNLKEKASFKAYELSIGEKKLLSLGCLLMNGARFLLLDEPFAGINGEAIAIVKATFGILKEEGITILMIEHNKEQLFEISDTVYKMKHGKLNRIESVDYANN